MLDLEFPKEGVRKPLFVKIIPGNSPDPSLPKEG